MCCDYGYKVIVHIVISNDAWLAGGIQHAHKSRHEATDCPLATTVMHALVACKGACWYAVGK